MDTNSQECAYMWAYTLYSWSLQSRFECLDQISRDILNISSQTSGTDISVSSPYRHSNVSCLVAPLPKSRSRLSLETLTSQSRHHTSCLQPCFWGPFRRGVRQNLNISTLAHYDYKQFIPIQWVIVCTNQPMNKQMTTLSSNCVSIITESIL